MVLFYANDCLNDFPFFIPSLCTFGSKYITVFVFFSYLFFRILDLLSFFVTMWQTSGRVDINEPSPRFKPPPTSPTLEFISGRYRGVEAGGPGVLPPNFFMKYCASLFYLSLSPTLLTRPLHFKGRFDPPEMISELSKRFSEYHRKDAPKGLNRIFTLIS